MDEEEIEKAEETDASLVYSVEELQPYTLTELLEPPSDNEDDEDDEDDPTYDEISKAFPKFRKKMRNVTSDGKVKKLVSAFSWTVAILNYRAKNVFQKTRTS